MLKDASSFGAMAYMCQETSLKFSGWMEEFLVLGTKWAQKSLFRIRVRSFLFNGFFLLLYFYCLHYYRYVLPPSTPLLTHTSTIGSSMPAPSDSD